MLRFVITGGAGFVGSHLVDRLLSQGHHVVAVDNCVTGTRVNLKHLEKEPRFEFVEGDISNQFPDVGRVDGVFNLASPASPIDFVPLAVPILKVGSQGTLNALEYAEKYRAWFLMASTSEVYGDPEQHPQSESYFGNVNPIGTRGVYDEAKRFSEALTSAFHRSGRVKTSIVRIFNTYGPRMRPNDGRVIPNFISQALKGEPLTVNGDGTQTRSLCYVDDLVGGIVRFWEYKPMQPINLGNHREMSMNELAEAIIKITNSKSKISYQPLPEGDPKQRCPVLTRAKETLHWEPTTKLEEGLRKTVEYFRSLLSG